jgi:hypothetical protein
METLKSLTFNEHDPEAPQQFQRKAELHIDSAKKTFKIDLSYDLASINKLDEMVDGIGKPKNLEQMIMVFGSFLGETIRRLYGGRWQWDDRYKTWAVTFPLATGGEDSAFVFAKVQKRFVNGTEDSLSFFAHVIDGRVKGRIP